MNGFNLSDIVDAKLCGASLSAIYLGSNKLWPTVIDYSQEYFTIQSRTDNNTIYWCLFESDTLDSYFAKTIEWSVDKINWTSVTSSLSGSVITTLNTGDKIYIKGSNSAYAINPNEYYTYNYFSSRSYGFFNVFGNIMSLIYGDNFTSYNTLTEDDTFFHLFDGSYVMDAGNLILPATTLTTACYRCMFQNCGYLTTAPELPATTLAKACYREMFWSCASLTTAPELPATTLTDFCYAYMFSQCGSLNYIKCLATTGIFPQNDSSTLGWCHNVAASGTFVKDNFATWRTNDNSGIPWGWTIQDAVDYSQEYFTIESLEDNNRILWILHGYDANAKSISYSTDKTNWTSVTSSSSGNVVTTLNTGDKVYIKGNNSAYGVDTSNYNMLSSDGQFKVYGNIMSLLYSDNFTSQYTLSNINSFYRFFKESKITDASNLILPATKLSSYCYQYMFQSCSYLTVAPELPATTLASYCYNNMFYGCTSLTTAPELPATTLTDFCYAYMFRGCTSLTTAPELPATTLTTGCYTYMFNNCQLLNYIKCLATSTSAYNCTRYWVDGVAASGTFVKDNFTTWSTGADGIPSGWTAQNAVDYSQEYFTIESLEDNNRILWKSYNTNSKTLSWSTDKTNWTSVTSSSSGRVITTLNTGGKVYIRGNNSAYTSQWGTYNYLTSDGQFNVYGNIMSLINGSDFVDKYTLSADYTFYHLFHGSKVVNASNLILPATTLRVSCYDNMFVSCKQLIYSPTILPATTLKNYCYSCMFDGCTSLITTPELPATTATDGCYYCMFRDTPITTAPELPATTLATECYIGMFQRCTSLTTPPELPATKLVNKCYRKMFNGCSSLNYIKCLATDISATECLYEWVNGVAQTGTFVKDNNATWPTGINGIPSGWTVQDAVDYSQKYFTIESLEDNNDIQFYRKSASAPTITIQWSTDGTNWNSYTSSTSSTAFTTLNTGDKIMIKATTTQYANGDNGNNSSRLASTKTINVYGNIMSLLYGDNFVGQTTLTAKYTFRSLFYQGKIVDASNLILPATTLTEVCYFGLFNECKTLTAAPKVLPALTVTNRCYLNMFCDCTSLASVEYNMLPATTLAPECYKGFLARTKITIAPLLPATTLRNYCYQWMYNGCSRLNNITCLATNISAYSCVDAWVIGVANSGTFYKAPSMTSWPRSTSGIPSGWTVVNASS